MATIEEINGALQYVEMSIDRVYESLRRLHLGSRLRPTPLLPGVETNLPVASGHFVQIGSTYRPFARLKAVERATFDVRDVGTHRRVTVHSKYKRAILVFRDRSVVIYAGRTYDTEQLEIEIPQSSAVRIAGGFTIADVFGVEYVEALSPVVQAISDELVGDTFFTGLTITRGPYERVTVIVDGTEIDVTDTHRFDIQPTVTPCKANSSYTTEYVGLTATPQGDHYLILRNVADRSDNVVNTGHPTGWKEGFNYYECVVLLEKDTRVDFGPNPLFIDGKRTLGRTTVSAGLHTVWVFKDNWAKYATKSTSLQFNHKKIVEGLGIVAQHVMRRIPLPVLKNMYGDKLPYYAMNGGPIVYSPLGGETCSRTAGEYDAREAFAILDFNDPPESVKVYIEDHRTICPGIILHSGV
jgi:hypothetical protein